MTLYAIADSDGWAVTDLRPAVRTGWWPLPLKVADGWIPGEWTAPLPPRSEGNPWYLLGTDGLSAGVAVSALWVAEGRGREYVDGPMIRYDEVRLLRPLGKISHPLLVSVACDWAEHARPYPIPAGFNEAIDAARAWTSPASEAHLGITDVAAAVAGTTAGYALAVRGVPGIAAQGVAVPAARDAADSAARDAANSARAVTTRASSAADATNATYGVDLDADLDAEAAYRAERRWQGRRLIEIVSTR
ncbi:MAG: hypothetical protein ACYCST_11240 [Acidimicrobiales bacterium]